MKFKPLLDRWKKETAPARTAKEYAIRLELDDASRLHALAELFPGQPLEVIITDLLHAGLDEIAAGAESWTDSKVFDVEVDWDRVGYAAYRSSDCRCVVAGCGCSVGGNCRIAADRGCEEVDQKASARGQCRSGWRE